MKLNRKLNHKCEEKDEETESITEHAGVDKETQRLKWRIYKRRYRQKMRKNAAVKKQNSSNPKRKTKGKANDGNKSRPANKVKDKISARDLECKPIQELVESEKIQNETEKQINKILIPGLFKTTGGKVTREKSKNKVSEMRRTTSTERTQELMREKWRQYKRNYRQRMRNKVVRPAYHSPGIVEEDTAIYFVEENINTNEYIFENDFSEEEHEYELKNENSLDIIEETFEELITVKCEPSDLIECVLKQNQ